MRVVSKIQLQLFNLIGSDSPTDLSMTEKISRVLNISTNRVYRRMGYQAVDTDKWGKWKKRCQDFFTFCAKKFQEEASIGTV